MIVKYTILKSLEVDNSKAFLLITNNTSII